MSFQFIQPTEEQKALMQEFRDKFEALYNEIGEKITNSRGKSLCMTKLEESAFWLNKSITENDGSKQADGTPPTEKEELNKPTE